MEDHNNSIESLKVNWRNFHYKSPDGMVLAALEWNIKEKQEGYLDMIPIMRWWMKWWTEHSDSETAYDDCKREIKTLDIWKDELVSNALSNYMRNDADVNLLEFVNMAITEFCHDDNTFKIYSINDINDKNFGAGDEIINEINSLILLLILKI